MLKNKFDEQGNVARRKARLVVRGFEQIYGIDYFETFASVVRYTTLRALLAKTAAEGLEADHIDVNTAFLNPVLREDIFMEIPQFFYNLDRQVKKGDAYLKLNKSLYGLKQAPRVWFKEVKEHFSKLGL